MASEFLPYPISETARVMGIACENDTAGPIAPLYTPHIASRKDAVLTGICLPRVSGTEGHPRPRRSREPFLAPGVAGGGTMPRASPGHVQSRPDGANHLQRAGDRQHAE